MPVFMVQNGARQTTAAPVVQATGAAIKTLIQIATATTEEIEIIQWSIDFDAFAAAAPVKVELLRTDVAATTGTAYSAADITKVTNPLGPTSTIQLGTALSCFGPSVEGATTAGIPYETHLVSPTSSMFVQYPQGRGLLLPVSTFFRLRVTAAATVNVYAQIWWNE